MSGTTIGQNEITEPEQRIRLDAEAFEELNRMLVSDIELTEAARRAAERFNKGRFEGDEYNWE